MSFLARATRLPAEYRGDLLVAYHGSWNRDTPTGAKVVRVRVAGGKPGAVEDFITGWQRADGSRWGRPVDVARRGRRQRADLRRSERRDLPRRAERAMIDAPTAARRARLLARWRASLPARERRQTPPSLTGSRISQASTFSITTSTLELPDTGLFLRGDVTVTARRAPALTALALDLIDSLTVRSVEVDGRSRHRDARGAT